MSDRNLIPLSLTSEQLLAAWRRLLDKEELQEGHFTTMMVWALALSERIEPQELRALIEDAIDVWSGWPEHAFALPEGATDEHMFVPLERIFESILATRLSEIASIYDVLPQELLFRWQRGLNRNFAVTIATREDEVDTLARRRRGRSYFNTSWFEMLTSEDPHTGSFLTMLAMAGARYPVLGRARTRMLLENATRYWETWPDHAFEAPWLGLDRFAGQEVDQSVLLTALLPVGLAQNFPLAEILPQNILERWLPGVRLTTSATSEEAPTAAREAIAFAERELSKFEPVFEDISSATLLTAGITFLQDEFEPRGDRQAELVEQLLFAMWSRLESLAKGDADITLSTSLVDTLTRDLGDVTMVALLDLANGVEIGDSHLLRRFTIFGGKAPVVSLALDTPGPLARAISPRLERLSLSDCDGAMLSTLFALKQELGGLRQLSVCSPDVPIASVIDGVLDSKSLATLERLALRGMKLDDESLLRLLDAPFQWLRSLDISRNPGVTAKGLTTLMSDWKFSELEDLCIDESSADRILAIGKATYSSSLRSLTARHCGIDTEAAKEISHLPGFESLRALDLSSNTLEAEGAAAIAAWPRLRRLTSLTLEHTFARDPGARAIANSIALQKLEHLSLYHNQITPEGVIELAEGRLKTLKELDLGLNTIDLSSLRKLITSPRLSNLEYLCIGQNLDGDILDILLQESELFRLKTLVVIVDVLSTDHLAAFDRPPNLPLLERVEVFARRPHEDCRNHSLPLTPMIRLRAIEEVEHRTRHATSLGPLAQLFRDASLA